MDVEDKKLTVTGDIDPVSIVRMLRKLCPAEILSVGPAKEPEKMSVGPAKKPEKEDDEKKKNEELHKACSAYTVVRAGENKKKKEDDEKKKNEELDKACSASTVVSAGKNPDACAIC